AEVQAVGRGAGEVELAATHVGAAVDHRHAHAAPAVADGQHGAAGQRLVGDAELAGAEAAATAQMGPVEAGPVPGRDRDAVHVEATQAPGDAHVLGVAEEAHAH